MNNAFLNDLVTVRVAIIIAVLILMSLLLRFIYYHAKHRAITRYYKEYERFREATSSDSTNHSAYADILEQQPEIVKLFKEAQLSPPLSAYAEPAG